MQIDLDPHFHMLYLSLELQLNKSDDILNSSFFSKPYVGGTH